MRYKLRCFKIKAGLHDTICRPDMLARDHRSVKLTCVYMLSAPGRPDLSARQYRIMNRTCIFSPDSMNFD